MNLFINLFIYLYTHRHGAHMSVNIPMSKHAHATGRVWRLSPNCRSQSPPTMWLLVETQVLKLCSMHLCLQNHPAKPTKLLLLKRQGNKKRLRMSRVSRYPSPLLAQLQTSTSGREADGNVYSDLKCACSLTLPLPKVQFWEKSKCQYTGSCTEWY